MVDDSQKREIMEGVGAFEAALIEKAIAIETPDVRAILLAVDRSNQDPTAIAIAGEVAGRCRAAVYVIYAPEGARSAEDERYCETVAAELRAPPWKLDAHAKCVNAPLPAQQILGAAQEVKADLVVLPAPYLRDLGLIGDQSLGSPVDMLMVELAAPLLIVRQPLAEPSECFARALIAVSAPTEEIGRAAGWALKLVDPRGTIELLAIADEAALQEAKALLDEKVARGALEAEALARAATKQAGALIAAVQKRGAEIGVGVHVEVKVGKAVEIEVAEANRRPCLVFTGTPNDRTSPAFHRAKDVALGSIYPVLVT